MALLPRPQGVPAGGRAVPPGLRPDLAAAVSDEDHVLRPGSIPGVVVSERAEAAATDAGQAERLGAARRAEGRPVPEHLVAFLELVHIGADGRRGVVDLVDPAARSRRRAASDPVDVGAEGRALLPGSRSSARLLARSSAPSGVGPDVVTTGPSGGLNAPVTGARRASALPKRVTFAPSTRIFTSTADAGEAG